MICKQDQLEEHPITINLFVNFSSPDEENPKANQNIDKISSSQNNSRLPDINLRIFFGKQRSRKEDGDGSGTNSNAVAGIEMVNNNTNVETQPRLPDYLSSSDSLSSNGEEINEMESPKVSHQVADETERRSNTNQANLPEQNARGQSLEVTNWSTYWPLCKKIQEKDWEGVEDFVGKHPEALTDNISQDEIIFHYLVSHFYGDEGGIASLTEKLAQKVDPKTLEKKDGFGRTVLHLCAGIGNTRASEILIKCNPDLPNIQAKIFNIPECVFLSPIHYAAYYGHKDTVQYLIQVTANDNLKGIGGANLISTLIGSNLYDLALEFLRRYPTMGRDDIDSRNIVLATLARKPLAFESGSRLGRLQRFIYNCIPVKKENVCSSIHHTETNKKESVEGDLENLIGRSKNHSIKPLSFASLGQITTTTFGFICQELQRMFWNALVLLVPCIKFLHDEKLRHMQAVEIVRIICEGVTWNDPKTNNILLASFHTAASFGISEIVNEIIRACNRSVYCNTLDGYNVFMTAVFHRQEKVFNLIYGVRFHNHMLSHWNSSGNNLLHIAGRLAPSTKVAGAALQMQRELQWFKAVENLLRPADHEKLNIRNETPSQRFTRKHQDLVKEGERWIKETATSCTVAVTLIITVVFAAAFTVPGGNNTNGLPNFLNDQAFLVFAISDALALFSSTTSLLMFLGILTSRYAEEDFLISLPRKLIIGLIALFVSVASMLVAFGATIYLVLFQPWKWVIIPISLLGCVPVTLFALLQFPLLLDMVLSTYGPSIFGPNK